MSIEKHGIAHGSKVHKDFVKLKDKYNKGTLPAWLNKMQVQYGIKHEELLNAYVEQLTGLRVIKTTDDASVMHNLINADTEDDVCRGFECFNDTKHMITQLQEGIEDVSDKVATLMEEKEDEDGNVTKLGCMAPEKIIPKITQKLKFVKQFEKPIGK